MNKNTIKILFLVCSLSMVLVLAGCHKKIHINEVSFKGDTAYYQQKPFDGEVWTEDDETGFFKIEKGILKSLKFYHRNGKDAATMVLEDGKSTAHFFDDEGKEISMSAFQTQYIDIWFNMAMVQGELMAQ